MTIKLQDKAAIRAGIKSVAKRSTTLTKDVHKWAIQCMAHAEKHGDASLMRDLIMGLGKAVRRADLYAWVENYSPIFIDLENPAKFGLLKQGVHKKYRPFDVEAADAKPFWELVPDAAPNFMAPADVIGKLFAARKQAEKAQEEGRFVGDYEATIKQLNAAIAGAGVNETDLEAMRETGKKLKAEAVEAANNNTSDLPAEAVSEAA